MMHIDKGQYLDMMEGNAGKEDVKDGRKQTGTDTAAD